MLDDNGNVVGTSRVAARHVCCFSSELDSSGAALFVYYKGLIEYLWIHVNDEVPLNMKIIQIVDLSCFASSFETAFVSFFLVFVTGTFRDSSDPSGPTNANSDAPPHHHGCTGKVRKCIIFFNWSQMY